MQSTLFSVLLLFLSATVCRAQQTHTTEAIAINRFDKALYNVIQTNDSASLANLNAEYPAMMEVIGKSIFNVRSSRSSPWMRRIMDYYAEPTLNALYADAISAYDRVDDIEKELGAAFAFLKGILPHLVTPNVYMHVSGFNQNVLVADTLLSLSIDKYLGKEYRLYTQFFEPYQRQRMERSRIVGDYLKGWLYAELPYEGKSNLLLERMIYEGKINYLIAQAIPLTEPHVLMGYTEKELAWCKKNESMIWKTMVEQKQLNTPDQTTTNQYLDEKPSTFISEEAPGSLGVWMGWQIVNQYLKESGSSIGALINNPNAQEILVQANYKP